MSRWAVSPPTPEDYLEGDDIEDEADENDELTPVMSEQPLQ